MISVLLYTKKHDVMTKVMAEQLELLGFQTEQTATINLPRLILNPYQVIHFIVSSLPLSWNEVFCMSAAKALGKAVVLSVLNAPLTANLQNYQHLSFNNPDALTVSQTNYLKLFRSKTGNKMIIPTLFESNSEIEAQPRAIEGFVFPLQKNLEEGLQLHTEKSVYFDARKLLEKMTSSQLRKSWNELLRENKIPANYELVLSESKMQAVLEGPPLGLLVAASDIKHSEFTHWFELALKNNHLLILNQFQATGFSKHWTSGQNCLVTTSANWIDELNSHMGDSLFNKPFLSKKLNQTSLDSLFNDLSRLYLKIIYQKTSLIDSDSAKI